MKDLQCFHTQYSDPQVTNSTLTKSTYRSTLIRSFLLQYHHGKPFMYRLNDENS